MKLRLTLALLALAALAAIPATSSAGTNRWFTTVAQTSKAIEAKYDVLGARCYAPSSIRDSATRYSAHSFVGSDGTRKWDTAVCALLLPDRTVCYAVPYQTGAYLRDMRLGTFFWRGCTPYQISRRPVGGATA